MKQLINYKIFGILLVSLLLLTNCSNDDSQVFNEAPSLRVDARVNELKSLLLSQSNNGYKAVYFTKNDQRGGFTLFMKFNADGSVRQTSDFDDNTALANSSYDVSLGSTVELVFTTRNHITKGTDPETVVEVINGRAAPQGFYGTSVFQFFKNDNGVLTFRDVRNRNTAFLTLTPTEFTDFDAQSVASVNQSLQNRKDLTTVDCETGSVFSVLSLTINDAEGSNRYNLNYEDNIFYAKPSRFGAGGVVELTPEFGIAFLEDGLQVSPALKVGAHTFENFTLNTTATGRQYVATVNGATATISDVRVSAPTGEDILDLPGSIYFYDTADGTNPLLSPCFQELVIDQINTNLDNLLGPGAFRFSFFAFFLDFTSDACNNQLSIWIQDAAGNAPIRVNYCYTRAVIANNKLTQSYVESFDTGTSLFLEDALMPLIQFFNSSEGLLYTNEGTFRASINNYTNLSGSFTSLDDESLRAYGLFF